VPEFFSAIHSHRNMQLFPSVATFFEQQFNHQSYLRKTEGHKEKSLCSLEEWPQLWRWRCAGSLAVAGDPERSKVGSRQSER